MRNAVKVKQALCLALIAILLMLTAAPALASSRGYGAYVVTTVEKHDRLCLRDSPKGSVEDYLKKGTVVVYKSSKSGWWYVEYRKGDDDVEHGYVHPSCLTSVADMTGSKFVSVDNIYVRKQHKTNSPKIKMKKGYKVKITGQYKSWVKITNSKGYSGWVPAIYMRKA